MYDITSRFKRAGMITKNKNENQHNVQRLTVSAFQTEILIVKLMQTKRENSEHGFAKSSKAWHNHGKKQNNLLSLRGWNKWYYSKVITDGDHIMIGDGNGDDSVSMSTYSQSECQSKSRQNQLLSCFSEQFMKIYSSKIDAPRYRLTVLRPRGQIDKRYWHMVGSNNQSHIWIHEGR